MYILNVGDILSNMTQRSTCDNGPNPLLVQFKTLVYGSFIAGIAGSNSTEGMDVHNLSLLCRYQPLRRAGNSFSGILRNLDPFDSNK